MILRVQGQLTTLFGALGSSDWLIKRDVLLICHRYPSYEIKQDGLAMIESNPVVPREIVSGSKSKYI